MPELPTGDTSTETNNPYLPPAPETTTGDAKPQGVLARIALWSGALIVGGLSTFGSMELFGRGPAGIVWAISNITGGALFGLGVVLFVLILVRRNFRTMHPGYWFALATLPELVGNLLAAPWAGQPLFMIGGEAYYTHGLVNNFATAFFRLALFLLIARFTQANRPWRIYAWTFVTLYAVQLLHLLLSVVFSMTYAEPLYYLMVIFAQGSKIGILASAIIAIIAIVNDGQKRVQRDGVHWASIVLATIHSVTAFLWPILTFYFRMG